MQIFKQGIFVLFMSIFLATGTQLAKAQELKLKKRVAVFVFEDKTDKGWRWWNNKSVGEGMSDMLTTELVKSEEFIVIERAELDEILAEQKLGLSGAVTEQSAAEIGKLLGVELAVVGAVTEFGYKDNKTGGRIKGIGIGVSNQSATVGVDCRFINTTTGEIIAADHFLKEKSTKGVKFNTSGLSFDSQKKFDESLVGKAAREAIEEVTEMLKENMPNVPWQAKVVTAKNGAVFINVGANHGVKPGDSFVIYKKGEELIDPDTGLSLGSMDTKIGEIKVTNASLGNGKASQCAIVNGDGFKSGDFVRIQ
ncbi:CsgG/HfaB family protein [Flexithrix dorotheae]|uniref:CsgG/HfaB family protein n=1 Tax=Flexithrix dorotheae TaxID=70993 RepID=UPI000375CA80|nr:CsgG/HfaB family protein [Flexithrix dorotheae]